MKTRSAIITHWLAGLNLIALLLVSPSIAQAAYTWTGNGTTSVGWGDNGNWSATPTFGNACDLIFYSSPNHLENFISGPTPGTGRTNRSLAFNANVTSPVKIDLASNTNGGIDRILTFDTATPPATITVDPSATAAITIGYIPQGVINLNQNLSIANSSPSATLTIGRPITESGGFRSVTTSGNVTYAGANSYSGGTTINAGTLTLNGSGTLGSTSGGLMLSGGTLDLGGSSETNGAVSITAAAASGNTIQNGKLTASSFTASHASGNANVTAVLAGSTAALTNSGAGTLTLLPSSGNNSYGGATVISAGKLVVQASQTGTGNITVADGADLGVMVSGNSQLSPATLAVGASSGATLEFNGITSTTVAPIHAGTLSSVGTVTININSGSLALSNTYPLLVWSSGSAPAVSLNQAALSALGVTAHLSTDSNSLKLVVDSSVNTWTGVSSGLWDTTTSGNWTDTTYSDGQAVVFDDTATGTTNVTVNQLVQPASVTLNNNLLTYAIASSGTNHIGGAATLTMNGSGSLTLSGGVNTYTGATSINGGLISVGLLANGGSASDIGASGNSAANLVINGGTLQCTGGTVSSDRLFTVGTNGATLDASGSGALNLTNNGAVSLSGSGSRLLTLTGSSADTNTLAAVVGDNGGPTSLGKSGSGTWILSGRNTYTGNTMVSGGTLVIQQSTLATNSSVSVDNGCVLQLNFATTNTIGALVLNGVSQPAGIYNSNTPGDNLAGTGSLQVAQSFPTNAIFWQGGTGNWTDPNWNVYGVLFQTLAAPPTVYSNVDFVFNFDTEDTLTSAGQPTLANCTWLQTSGTISLTGGGNNPGLTIGTSGAPSTAVLSGDANLYLTGSGTATADINCQAGTLTLSNTASITCNNQDFIIHNGCTLTMRDNSQVIAPDLHFPDGNPSTAYVNLYSGSITLTSTNPIRALAYPTTAPGACINFTGPAGAAQVNSSGNPDSTHNLAAKMGHNYFCIDGRFVTNQTTFVNGRRFQITSVGGIDTLSLMTNLPGVGGLTYTLLPSFPGGGVAQNPPPVTAGTNAVVANGQMIGQIITLTKGLTLTNLVLQIDNASTSADLTGNLEVDIYQTLDQLPYIWASFSTFTHFSDSGTLPAGLTNGSVLQVYFQNPPVMPRGQYAIVLSSTNASINFKLSSGAAYDPPSGGLLKYVPGGGILENGTGITNNWTPATPAGLDLVFAAFGTQTNDPPPPTNHPPNIIFILADDMSWTDPQTDTNFYYGHPLADTHTGPNIINGLNYGNDYAQTPNIARLAREGLSFTWCRFQPNCMPSRGALLSGQFAERSGNGIYGNGLQSYGSLKAPFDGQDIPGSTVVHAEVLRAAGYVTAHFGKWHIGGHVANDGSLPLQQGFDCNFGGTSAGDVGATYFASAAGVFDGNIGPALNTWGAEYTTNYVNSTLWPMATNHAPIPNNPGTLIGTKKHVGDAMGDAIHAWFKDYLNGPFTNRPFFIQYFTYEPHEPIQPRPDLLAKYNGITAGKVHTRADDAGLDEGQDQQVGRILDFMADPHGDGSGRDSLVSNTVVFFASDNGGWIPDTQNWPLRAGKATFYEGGLRVPLIVRWPGHVPAGKVTDTMVHAVDFYPTYLDVAGVAVPTNVWLDGVSFAAHMLDPVGHPRQRGPICYHFPGYYDYRARPCDTVIEEINGKRYKLIYNYDYTYTGGGITFTPQTWNIPGQTYLQVLTQPWEFYDLTDDLSEMTNYMEGETYTGWLIDSPIANQMAADLHAWLTQTTPGWYAEQMTDTNTGLLLAFPPVTIPAVSPPNGRTFTITSANVNHPLNQITLQWNAETGFLYSIWASSDLLNWTNLAANLSTSGSSILLTTNDPALGSAQRYYRIGVNRP